MSRGFNAQIVTEQNDIGYQVQDMLEGLILDVEELSSFFEEGGWADDSYDDDPYDRASESHLQAEVFQVF